MFSHANSVTRETRMFDTLNRAISLPVVYIRQAEQEACNKIILCNKLIRRSL